MIVPHRLLQRLGLIAGIGLVSVLLVTAILIAGQSSAGASSHREAPMISKDPFADNTDTYVFVSPENPDNLVLIASWIPFEAPEGGPNYWEWDDRVAYDIHIDIDGDATSEVTYTLRSRVDVVNPDTFLYNTNTINTPDDTDWNRRQFYTVTETFEPGMQPDGGEGADAHITTLIENALTAPVNIGSKSTPNYVALESAATYEVTDKGDTIKVFAGQTDDPFFVDLQIFDLLTLRGHQPPIGYQEGNNIAVDSLSGFNVHTLVVEVPISRFVNTYEPVVGVWAASRRPSMEVTGENGELKQVSRLGMPLVNEVVLPMGLKDVFNSIRPEQDLGVYNVLQESVEDPEVGNLLCNLYGVPLPEDNNNDCRTEYAADTPGSGRGDIFDIFLTGMVLKNEFTIQTADGPITLPPGFNINRPANVQPAEMIRINTNIKGNLCKPTPSRLGVLGGDACGFPNGRRLTDDVVEIELLAVAGAAYEVLDGGDDSFSFNPDLIQVLTDHVDTNDQPFRDTFPYVPLAQSGQSHLHENPLIGVFLPFIKNVGAVTGRMGSEVPVGTASLALLPLIGTAAFLWARRRKR